MNPQFPGQYGQGQPQMGPPGQPGAPPGQPGGMRQPMYNGQPPVTGKDKENRALVDLSLFSSILIFFMYIYVFQYFSNNFAGIKFNKFI